MCLEGIMDGSHALHRQILKLAKTGGPEFRKRVSRDPIFSTFSHWKQLVRNIKDDVLSREYSST